MRDAPDADAAATACPDEGARDGASAVRLGDAERVDMRLRAARSHPALRRTPGDRATDDLARVTTTNDQRVSGVVHRVVPPQELARGGTTLLEGLHGWRGSAPAEPGTGRTRYVAREHRHLAGSRYAEPDALNGSLM